MDGGLRLLSALKFRSCFEVRLSLQYCTILSLTGRLHS